MKGRVRSVVLGALLGVTASGCTSTGDLTNQVGRINKSIELVQNEAILLNVVRASESAPLSFTQFSVVGGSGTMGGTLGMPTINFGPGTPIPNSFGSTTTATTSRNTNFNLGVLESKEFWLGLQTPLHADTLAYFIREGMPREVLFYLYISRMELISRGRKEVLENDPTKPTFPRFLTTLRTALSLGLTTETVPNVVEYGPPIPAAKASDMSDLVELAKAGLVLYPTSMGDEAAYQVASVKTVGVLCIEPALASGYSDFSVGPEGTCDVLKASGVSQADSADTGAHHFAFMRQGSGVELTLYMRSTFDIFQYLGALIRTSTEIELVTKEGRAFDANASNARLFVVDVNLSSGDDLVSVKYRNDIYSIAGSETATVRILSLLRRLVALSTSVNDLPAASNVTAIVQ